MNILFCTIFSMLRSNIHFSRPFNFYKWFYWRYEIGRHSFWTTSETHIIRSNIFVVIVCFVSFVLLFILKCEWWMCARCTREKREGWEYRECVYMRDKRTVRGVWGERFFSTVLLLTFFLVRIYSRAYTWMFVFEWMSERVRIDCMFI